MSLLIVFEGYQTGERQSVIPGTKLLRCQCTLFNLGVSNCTITGHQNTKPGQPKKETRIKSKFILQENLQSLGNPGNS